MNLVTDVVVSHNSLVSLHSQLHNQLRHLILSGHWAAGTRIPSESEFVEHLRLSRSTVRLALQQAEIEGLIERIAGRGTFVIYKPNKEHINRTIAFLTCDFDSETQLMALNGIENEARSRGYQVVFSQSRTRQEEIAVLKTLESQDAGVVLWSNGSDMSQVDSHLYQQLRIPIVLLDRTIEGFACDSVTSDNYGGAYALIQHLIEIGHRHIALLSHHEMLVSTVKDRYHAYQDALRANGLTPIDPWMIGRPGTEIGFPRMLRASLDSKSLELQQIGDYMRTVQPRPTAIFAINDLMAVLTMRAMRHLALIVPEAMSIAGFDDTDLAAHLDVPLTTVAQDSFTIGKTAARLLIDRIEGQSGAVVQQIIPTQLRIRSSTALPVRV